MRAGPGLGQGLLRVLRLLPSAAPPPLAACGQPAGPSAAAFGPRLSRVSPPSRPTRVCLPAAFRCGPGFPHRRPCTSQLVPLYRSPLLAKPSPRPPRPFGLPTFALSFHPPHRLPFLTSVAFLPFFIPLFLIISVVVSTNNSSNRLLGTYSVPVNPLLRFVSFNPHDHLLE